MLDKLIVIDPGHSGNPDPGACGAYSKESNLAWRISCKVRDLLAFKWGLKVVLTKQSENDPTSDSLSSRYSKSNALGADLFVSIHLNGATPQAHGIETYSAPGSQRGAVLAAQIQKQLVGCLKLTDRGVKTAEYSVLTQTDCPAALAEVCFITNPTEEAFINQEVNIQKAADAIAQGIIDYFYS